MKPLTIEQLKALEVGDWVWIIDKECPRYTGYYKIDLFEVSHLKLLQGLGVTLISYATYGEEWLAYKNKEQAGAKGEIVDLSTQDKEQQIDEILDILSSYDDGECVGMALTIYNAGFRKIPNLAYRN